MEEICNCVEGMDRFRIVAGDDVTFKVNFYNPEEPQWEFSENDLTAMIISGDGIDDIVISGEISGKEATYYISSENTELMYNAIQPKLSVKVYFAAGGRYTPITNLPLSVVEG